MSGPPSGWLLEAVGNRCPRLMATVRFGGHRTRLIGLLDPQRRLARR